MKPAILRKLLLFLLTSVCLTASASANETQVENANPGTTAWQLTHPPTSPAVFRQIEGYASLTSVNVGGSISFFVSTSDSSYTMDFYRIGWYGGAGGREVLGPISRPGGLQPTPSPDAYGTFECNWTNPYVLTVPTSWVSGVYLVKLTSASGWQIYIQFVVREDSRNSVYLFQRSITTDQAYNNWPGVAYGGKSLYGFNSANNSPAVKVSFNRPYGIEESYTTTHYGAGFFPEWELNMVRWLEMNGYDVSYVTDIDLHENPNLLLTHKAFLVVGHDEYWSWEMRANVEAARDAGVGLGFFGGNISFWQMRLEPSAITSATDRTMVVFRSVNDPTTNVCLQTILWRQNTCKPSEQAFIGVESSGYSVGGDDMVITDASNWALTGTSLLNGSIIPGVLGVEVDGLVQADSPTGTALISHSPLDSNALSDTAPYPAYPYSDMVTYTAAASGATVFSVGTIQWSWTLDDWGAPAQRASILNMAAQQITQNVLARLVKADFSIALASSSQTSLQGGSGAYTVNVGSINGVDSIVNLTCTGLPTGATCSPASVLTSGSATLTLGVSGSVAPGTYPFTITGTNGNTTHSPPQQATIVVGTVTATISPGTSATINVGSNATFTVSLSSTNSASGPVSLSCAGLAAGLSCTWSPTQQVTVPASGSVTTTLTVSVNAKPTASLVHIGSPDLREHIRPHYSATSSLAFAVLLLMTASIIIIFRRGDSGPLTARGLTMLMLTVVVAVGLISCGSKGGGGGGSNPVTTQFALHGQSGTATMNLSTMSVTVP